MKSPFDIVNEILFTKKTERLLPGEEPNQFLVNKIISYQSPVFCQLVNNTSNIYYNVLDGQQMVDFLRVIFPKNRWKKLEWLMPKKDKEKKVLDSPAITQLCENMEISRKDLNAALEIFPDALKGLVEEEKVYKKLDSKE